jgi:nitrate/nitrite transporter NarK
MSSEVGFLIWLPSVIQKAKGLSSTGIGSLATFPFIVAIVAMLANSWHSDRTGERRAHVAVPFALGGIFLLAGVLTSHNSTVLAFVFVCLSTIGTYGPLGPFWAIPTETLPRNIAATTMGVITAVGSLGGFFGPVVIGYLNKREGNFQDGFGLIGVVLLIISALCLRINCLRAPAVIES